METTIRVIGDDEGVLPRRDGDARREKRGKSHLNCCCPDKGRPFCDRFHEGIGVDLNHLEEAASSPLYQTQTSSALLI